MPFLLLLVFFVVVVPLALLAFLCFAIALALKVIVSLGIYFVVIGLVVAIVFRRRSLSPGPTALPGFPPPPRIETLSEDRPPYNPVRNIPRVRDHRGPNGPDSH